MTRARAAAGWVLAGMVAACGHAPAHDRNDDRSSWTPPPPLLEPLPGAPSTFGAAYLQRVATLLREPWRELVEHCRTRLPPTHWLNDPSLATTVELIRLEDGATEVRFVEVANQVDFDSAVYEIATRVVLPEPPADLLGDDGVLRLRWQFSRDRRGAGWGTAAVTSTRQSPAEVVPRLLASGDFARAAQRALEAATPAEVAALGRQIFESLFLRHVAWVSLRVAAQRDAIVAGEATAATATGPHLDEQMFRLRAVWPRQALPRGGPEAQLWLREFDAWFDDDAWVLGRVVEVPGTGELLREYFAPRLGSRTAAPRALLVLAVVGAGGATRAVAPWVRKPDPVLVGRACAALAPALSTDALARRAVRVGLGHAAASARAACARALAHPGGVPGDVRATLLERLDDPDPDVRGAAAAALAAAPLAPEAALALEERFADPVVFAAVMASTQAMRLWPQHVLRGVVHEEAAVRAAMVRHCTGASGILAAARRDAEPAVRLAAVESGPPVFDPVLLDDPLDAIRHTAWRRWAEADASAALAGGLRRLAAQERAALDPWLIMGVALVDPTGELAASKLAEPGALPPLSP